MRVVVTGASGFLGSAVLKKLAGAGFNVVGVTRKKTLGMFHVNKYCESPAGDVLIHLAEVNNRTQVNQLSDAYEHEVSSTLKALLSKGYEKVIYASSSVLYGDAVITPHIESDPVNAIDTYSRLKLASEKSVLSLGGVVARLANIYGPGMASENVLSHIFGQLDQDGPITLQNTSPVRDFIWIEDAAEAIMKMVGGRVGGVFNVGTGIGTSIGGLTRMLLEQVKQPQRQIVSSHSTAKSSCIILDITKAQKNLHWQPSVFLNEGLRRLLRSQIGIKSK